MARPGRVLRASWRLGGIVSITLSGISCSSSSDDSEQPIYRPDRPSAQQIVEVPDGTPDELIALAKKSLRESKRIAQEVSAESGSKSSKKALRDKLRLSIVVGVTAAEKALDHQEATDEQRHIARRSKLLLLYRGVKRDRLKFEPVLDEFVEELLAEQPESKEAAFGVAVRLELKCLSSQARKSKLLPELIEYAQRHPDNKAGVSLFDVLARQLEARSDHDGAIECYQKGIQSYANHSNVKQLEQGLSRLQSARIRLVGNRTKLDAEGRDIQRRLGGYPDGYFVIYAEEKVTPPRGSMMYFYHYEYEVLEGLRSAITYVKNLPEKYSWRLERRYPSTSEGRKEAFELWKKLLDKKSDGKL